MTFVYQLDLRAPAPVRSAVGIGETAQDKKAVVCDIARAKHDGGVVVERIQPAGLIAVQRRVVAKGEQPMLGLTQDSPLIKIKREASVENQLDGSHHGRFIGEFIGLQPKPGCACPAAGELGEKMMWAA